MRILLSVKPAVGEEAVQAAAGIAPAAVGGAAGKVMQEGRARILASPVLSPSVVT